MSNKVRVLNHLQALSIPCEVYEHPAVFTLELQENLLETASVSF